MQEVVILQTKSRIKLFILEIGSRLKMQLIIKKLSMSHLV